MQPAPVLHLLCFDLPVPPLYGGTEELDTKIRILLDLGVALHVHAFVWPKDLHSGKMPDWHQRVASLRCYPRRWMVGPYDARPWALISRTSSELIHNLASEPGPVLVEGWQCADLLRAPALKTGSSGFVPITLSRTITACRLNQPGDGYIRPITD